MLCDKISLSRFNQIDQTPQLKDNVKGKFYFEARRWKLYATNSRDSSGGNRYFKHKIGCGVFPDHSDPYLDPPEFLFSGGPRKDNRIEIILDVNETS